MKNTPGFDTPIISAPLAISSARDRGRNAGISLANEDSGLDDAAKPSPAGRSMDIAASECQQPK